MEAFDHSNLRFWPLESMARFGQNPFHENIWRIVHAPSRRSLVHGHGHKPKWLPTYPQAGTCWVLEKWLSAYDFTKCTPEVWNMSMTLLGPYPSRGEYELAHVFSSVLPSDVNLEKLISWIEAGKNHSAYENSVSLRDDATRQETSERKERLDKIRDLLPAYGNAPMSGLGGGRGTKTFDLPHTAQSAGLPTKGGHIIQRKSAKQYDVSELITA